MAEPDILERLLTSGLAFVVDVLNFIFYNGEPVVTEEDIEFLHEELPFFDSKGKLRELRRDSFFLWRRGNVVLSFIGLESQTRIDKDMPLRGAAYDGMCYYDQLTSSDGKRYPVITFVLYYGEKPWTKYLSLSERFNIPSDVRPIIAPYFNDYKVNVIDIRRIAPEDIAKFRSVLRYVASYFYMCDHPTEKIDIPPTKDVTPIAQFMKVFFGTDDVSWVPLEELEKGELTMDSLIQRYIKKQQNDVIVAERAEALEEGIEMGIEKAKRKIVLNMSKQGFSIEQIARTVDSDEVVVESWLAEME